MISPGTGTQDADKEQPCSPCSSLKSRAQGATGRFPQRETCHAQIRPGRHVPLGEQGLAAAARWGGESTLFKEKQNEEKRKESVVWSRGPCQSRRAAQLQSCPQSLPSQTPQLLRSGTRQLLGLPLTSVHFSLGREVESSRVGFRLFYDGVLSFLGWQWLGFPQYDQAVVGVKGFVFVCVV